MYWSLDLSLRLDKTGGRRKQLAAKIPPKINQKNKINKNQITSLVAEATFCFCFAQSSCFLLTPDL